MDALERGWGGREKRPKGVLHEKMDLRVFPKGLKIEDIKVDGPIQFLEVDQYLKLGKLRSISIFMEILKVSFYSFSAGTE